MSSTVWYISFNKKSVNLQKYPKKSNKKLEKTKKTRKKKNER